MKEENDGEMRRREDADGSMFDQQRGAEDGEVKLNHRREKKKNPACFAGRKISRPDTDNIIHKSELKILWKKCYDKLGFTCLSALHSPEL